MSQLCPSFESRYIKWAVLIAIVGQNAALLVVASHSRHKPAPVHYFGSVAVAATEALKAVAILLAALATDGRELRARLDAQFQAHHPLAFALPSLCYMLHNNLWYVAVTHLDPVTVAVATQSKIGFAALFSRLLIGRRLSATRWSALGVLVVGLTLVQRHAVLSRSSPAAPSQQHDAHAQRHGDEHDPWLGALAMLGLCTLSGFAGTVTEMLLKDRRAESSLWVRNMHMSVYSLPLALGAMLAYDGRDVIRSGPWVGFDRETVWIVLLGSVGGLLTSAALRFADNLLKSVAVALSVAVSCVVSTFALDTRVSASAALGVALVVFASAVYSWMPSAAAAGDGALSAVDDREPSGAVGATTSAGRTDRVRTGGGLAVYERVSLVPDVPDVSST